MCSPVHGATPITNLMGAASSHSTATGPLPHWQLHDLRRTARSLMCRAGVRDEYAERHTIGGVEGIYNRHDQYEHKREALKALAGLIESILRNDDADKKVRRLRG